MTRRIVTFVGAVVLASALGACSGSATVTAQNPIPAVQSFLQSLQDSGTATTAVETTKSNPVVQQQAASDLMPYRCEFDATVKAWIVYYYSPSQQKSYVCRPQADKTVVVTQVTDVNLVYQEGDTIDTSKVSVDAKTACENAIKQAPSPAPTAAPSGTPTAAPTTAPAGTTTNVTNNVVVQNVYLISANEAKKKHNKNSSNPVYVVVTNNQNIYVDASTGNTITATDGGAVTVGAGTSTGGTVVTNPTPAASTAPVATPTPAASTDPAATASPAASASPM